ncbi:MAG: ATP-binding cassette domain-containing protein [Bacteroidota bacterium]
MNIKAENLGKKFRKHWVFRNLNFDVQEGALTAVTGNNGSGKSTLLQILSGYLTPSEGDIYLNKSKIGIEDHHLIGFAAPYIELPEEFSFEEFMTFHSTFRETHFSIGEMAERSSLPLMKPMTDFSTGMKQRAQLCTIFYFKNELLFMDEPTANLDAEGFEWWAKETELLKTTTVIASNQEREIDICQENISLS